MGNNFWVKLIMQNKSFHPKEFGQAFDRFLEHLSISTVHLYGCGLGGFLAQYYASNFPKRVLSLLLESAYIDTKKYAGVTGNSFYLLFYYFTTTFICISLLLL